MDKPITIGLDLAKNVLGGPMFQIQYLFHRSKPGRLTLVSI